MAYMNVIPAAQIPLPNVRGLGQARIVRPRGMRGLGQLSAAGYSSCAAYLAANLAALPPVGTAAMLLNTGSPSGEVLSSLFINNLPSTPEATAQAIVQQLAAEYCGYSSDQVVFGGTLSSDCADNGAAAANAAYPQWLAYYQALPSSVWSSGTVSAQVANPTVFVTEPGPTQSGGGGGGGSSSIPVTAQIANVSRPGQPFQIGDTFQLTITGAPNSEVIQVLAAQNGTLLGAGWSPGSTDSTGKLVYSDIFPASAIGTWQESYAVQNSQNSAATVNFSVSAAPAAGGSGGGSGASSNTGGGGTSNTGGGSITPLTTGFTVPSFLTNDVSLLGFNVPVWGLIAAGVGLVFLMPRGR